MAVWLVRRWRLLSGLIAALSVGLICLPVGAADLRQADRGEIRDIIIRQMEAFRADDAAVAYSFAAPAIKAAFSTPQAFMAMVKRRYRPVYRPRSFVFAALRRSDGKTIQTVSLTGPDGTAVDAHYVMERQPSGVWKIAGVLLAAPGGERAGIGPGGLIAWRIEPAILRADEPSKERLNGTALAAEPQ